MAQRTTIIASAAGLHARPASILAKAAGASRHSVMVTVKGRTADARSLLSVLGLAASQGDEVVIDVDGPDDDRVADDIADLLASDLDA
jgi:phosphocarrier protein HPr